MPCKPVRACHHAWWPLRVALGRYLGLRMRDTLRHRLGHNFLARVQLIPLKYPRVEIVTGSAERAEWMKSCLNDSSFTRFWLPADGPSDPPRPRHLDHL